MIAANRKTVLCLGMIAYTLTAICAPANAVLCLGLNGHIAVEAEHDDCCTHTSNEAPGVRMKAAEAAPLHRCCIDIPLPAQNRPCTIDLHEPTGNPGRAETPCAQFINPVAPAAPAPAFDATTHTSDPPTATVVLLI